MKQLEHADLLHLNAAQGWLGLGDLVSASDELEEITPTMRAHPCVLELRWDIYAKAKKWEMAAEVARGLSEMLPDHSWTFIHYAYCLHELKRTKEAYAVLIPVADKFSDYLIRYNLACYSCQMGNLKEAKQWLKAAIAAAGKREIRAMALDDPDLKSLWEHIGQI